MPSSLSQVGSGPASDWFWGSAQHTTSDPSRLIWLTSSHLKRRSDFCFFFRTALPNVFSSELTLSSPAVESRVEGDPYDDLAELFYTGDKMSEIYSPLKLAVNAGLAFGQTHLDEHFRDNSVVSCCFYYFVDFMNISETIRRGREDDFVDFMSTHDASMSFSCDLDSVPVKCSCNVPLASDATAWMPAPTVTVEGFHNVSSVIELAPEIVSGATVLF
jgi:hypothetical protein